MIELQVAENMMVFAPDVLVLMDEEGNLYSLHTDKGLSRIIKGIRKVDNGITEYEAVAAYKAGQS